VNHFIARFSRQSLSGLSVLLVLLLAAASVRAQVVIAPKNPVIGSSNTVTAEPRITPVAGAKTCTVSLFNNFEFNEYAAKSFSYTPSAKCAGPWAKVVFSADFTVTAGVQYDRTVQVYLGGANLLFGTTPEPGTTLSPSWHVERDVTDLSQIFNSAQDGNVILYNIVNSTYTGIIWGNAQLTFYEPTAAVAAATVPNQVIGFPGNAGPASLNHSGSVYKKKLTLPTNVTSAYLDVIAQSQSNDEFWYTCVPNSLSSELESCGNSGFRETEITIDGNPAGVAPVYPWIYTGGMDPYLWEPIPGLQTLNFKPYRVDLTPFAGVLSDGLTHTVGIQVYNADSYFAVTANLLLYTDPTLKTVEGRVLSNTLTAEPKPVVTNGIYADGNGVYGSVSIDSDRSYVISGKVTTSKGTAITTVKQTINFNQDQYFTIDSDLYQQNIIQLTTANGKSTTTVGGATTATATNFSLYIDEAVNPDGTISEALQSSQQDVTEVTKYASSAVVDSSSVTNTVDSQDTLNFDASGNFTGDSNATSSQVYQAEDTDGVCYNETLKSANRKLKSVSKNTTCGN
jgi:hypothetical protein